MENIKEKLESLKEDKPGIVITDDLIKEYILDNIDLIVKEIKDE